MIAPAVVLVEQPPEAPARILVFLWPLTLEAGIFRGRICEDGCAKYNEEQGKSIIPTFLTDNSLELCSSVGGMLGLFIVSSR